MLKGLLYGLGGTRPRHFEVTFAQLLESDVKACAHVPREQDLISEFIRLTSKLDIWACWNEAYHKRGDHEDDQEHSTKNEDYRQSVEAP